MPCPGALGSAGLLNMGNVCSQASGHLWWSLYGPGSVGCLVEWRSPFFPRRCGLQSVAELGPLLRVPGGVCARVLLRSAVCARTGWSTQPRRPQLRASRSQVVTLARTPRPSQAETADHAADQEDRGAAKEAKRSLSHSAIASATRPSTAKRASWACAELTRSECVMQSRGFSCAGRAPKGLSKCRPERPGGCGRTVPSLRPLPCDAVPTTQPHPGLACSPARKHRRIAPSTTRRHGA